MYIIQLYKVQRESSYIYYIKFYYRDQRQNNYQARARYTPAN